MLKRNSARIAISCAALALTFATARAADAPKYPDWGGQWQRIAVQGLRGQPSYDPTKSWGKGQQAPLTPEYQAVLEANLKDQENGGHGGLVGWTCRPYGMPMMMYGFSPLEFVVTPKTTYVLINLLDTMRRIYTDDRTMPDDAVPSFQGYSTGRWVDQDGDGVYDVLEVETRNFKGPRFYDEAGVPLAHRQRVRLQGTHLPRQKRCQRPARRDHDDRSCAHPSVDGDQELSPRRQ